MLYHRDHQTGEHLVTHEGRDWRFTSRAKALAAADDLRRKADDQGPDTGRA